MGYTNFSWSKINPLLSGVKSLLDLGSQQDYSQPKLPAPFVRSIYEKRGIKYQSLDINNEGGAIPFDLSLVGVFHEQFDLVADLGTSEHVGSDGAFSWQAIYNCWLNKHNGLKIGGIMYNENPKSGNWPGHGFQYYTKEFYRELVEHSDYEIIELGQHPACNNTTDGWNIYCILKKHSENFPSLEQFKSFSLKNQ